MTLNELLQQEQSGFEQAFGPRLLPGHYRAMNCMRQCHTPECGQWHYQCNECDETKTLNAGCGHRHCPSCQHSANESWLEKQKGRCLPVTDFMVTFTLPEALRTWAYRHQKAAFNWLFECGMQTLKDFFERDRHRGECPGMLAVLHTHSRKLNYHPHVHILVPGAWLDKGGHLTAAKKSTYLFKTDNLAKVFRGKFLTDIHQQYDDVPAKIPKQWVADCRPVGDGVPAFTYLAKYLYRGVLSNKQLLHVDGEQVTWRYTDNQAQTHVISEHVHSFLWRVMQHVLPKGLRRVRSCGVLHGNAKKRLARLMSKMGIKPPPAPKQPDTKTTVLCPCCHSPMRLTGMTLPNKALPGSPT